ncbi:MAG: protein translocase subunit SecF [Chloroflexi bacterium]|nr:protein translocase subunit SecF [Chloroflexota bacterium]MBI2979929.1 protein translocase subunit SecF [Chloroflexota bacterium]
MLNIIGKRFWYFLISGIVILAGVIALAIFGLQPGIEFTSGSELTISFTQPVDKQQVTQALADLGYGSGSATVRKAGNDFLLGLPELTDGAKATLRAALTEKVGQFQDGGFQSVSARAATDTTRNATIAVIISAIGMLLYISWAFHRMPNPFRWGVCAIASLVHDVLVVLGVFAIFGAIFSWQVDLMFIAAVLTVIGYSVNDTIVIFDRIRENISKNPGLDFEVVVNNSLLETISRSVITGLGTLFVLVALSLFVGAAIQNLVVVLLVGIITGTYSSFGTAASLLVVWKKGEWGRFLMRQPPTTARS